MTQTKHPPIPTSLLLAFRKYGQHTDECKRKFAGHFPRPSCICGYDEVLADLLEYQHFPTPDSSLVDAIASRLNCPGSPGCKACLENAKEIIAMVHAHLSPESSLVDTVMKMQSYKLTATSSEVLVERVDVLQAIVDNTARRIPGREGLLEAMVEEMEAIKYTPDQGMDAEMEASNAAIDDCVAIICRHEVEVSKETASHCKVREVCHNNNLSDMGASDISATAVELAGSATRKDAVSEAPASMFDKDSDWPGEPGHYHTPDHVLQRGEIPDIAQLQTVIIHAMDRYESDVHRNNRESDEFYCEGEAGYIIEAILPYLATREPVRSWEISGVFDDEAAEYAYQYSLPLGRAQVDIVISHYLRYLEKHSVQKMRSTPEPVSLDLIIDDPEFSNQISDRYTPHDDWKRDVAKSVLNAAIKQGSRFVYAD